MRAGQLELQGKVQQCSMDVAAHSEQVCARVPLDVVPRLLRVCMQLSGLTGLDDLVASQSKLEAMQTQIARTGRAPFYSCVRISSWAALWRLAGLVDALQSSRQDEVEEREKRKSFAAAADTCQSQGECVVVACCPPSGEGSRESVGFASGGQNGAAGCTGLLGSAPQQS